MSGKVKSRPSFDGTIADNFADDRYSRLVLIHAAIKKLKHELENSNVVLDHLTHVVKA